MMSLRPRYAAACRDRVAELVAGVNFRAGRFDKKADRFQSRFRHEVSALKILLQARGDQNRFSPSGCRDGRVRARAQQNFQRRHIVGLCGR